MPAQSKIDLHIISFDVPYPADYGGVIDVYYKIKALKEIGLSVALHCFHYGREEQDQLLDLCEEVHYYPRRTGLMAQLSATPYIVSSRKAPSLLNQLAKDEAPILFEGLHTTYYLGHQKLKGRKTAVRVHNREEEYYRALFSQSKSLYKKSFYGIESQKLKYFENRLSKADVLFCLSNAEQEHYRSIHSDVRYLPVFHPYKKREESIIKHILKQGVYFGNLAVEENIEAVSFLLEVFDELNYPLKIVGRGAESDLLKKIDECQQVEYLGELSDSDLKRILAESKVCCLPTPQSTGIKLKWVQALHQANEIIINREMLADEHFKAYGHLANSKAEWMDELEKIFSSDLNEAKIRERMNIAVERFDNKRLAIVLKEWCAPAQ